MATVYCYDKRCGNKKRGERDRCALEDVGVSAYGECLCFKETDNKKNKKNKKGNK
jgi:hypothetical protein